jgi:hypothetical protein
MVDETTLALRVLRRHAQTLRQGLSSFQTGDDGKFSRALAAE